MAIGLEEREEHCEELRSGHGMTLQLGRHSGCAVTTWEGVHGMDMKWEGKTGQGKLRE